MRATRAVSIFVALLMVPSAAWASGSWAVPRFTPTWSELQRDLKALGFSASTKKRPTPVRKKPLEKPKVAGEGTATEKKVTTTVAETKTDATDTTAKGDGTTALTGTVDRAAVAPPYGSCSAYCLPMPVCVEGSPLIPQHKPQPMSAAPEPQAEQQPVTPPTNPETITEKAPEEQPPAVDAQTVKPSEKGVKKKATSSGNKAKEKTGRPKADDVKDEGKLKKKKYWWQDQQ